MEHVEQITNTINILLEGASTNSNNPNELPLSIALESPNIHHFLVAAQSARPVRYSRKSLVCFLCIL